MNNSLIRYFKYHYYKQSGINREELLRVHKELLYHLGACFGTVLQVFAALGDRLGNYLNQIQKNGPYMGFLIFLLLRVMLLKENLLYYRFMFQQGEGWQLISLSFPTFSYEQEI